LNLLKNEKYIDDQTAIKLLLYELIETVTKEVTCCDTPHSLAGTGSFGIATTMLRNPLNSQCNELKSSVNNARESKLGVEWDKNMEEEVEIADSPCIENCDSPVYPVITSSHLACLEDDSIHQFHSSMAKINCDENMTAMISALALLSSDRLGLVERNRVEHIQHLYACVLQNYVQGTKKHNVSAFANILSLLATVRDVTSLMSRFLHQ